MTPPSIYEPARAPAPLPWPAPQTRVLAPGNSNARALVIWNQRAPHTPWPQLEGRRRRRRRPAPWEAAVLLQISCGAVPFVCCTYLELADGRSSPAWPSGGLGPGIASPVQAYS